MLLVLQFTANEAVTVLEGIDLSIGRTGCIIPTARLKVVGLLMLVVKNLPGDRLLYDAGFCFFCAQACFGRSGLLDLKHVFAASAVGRSHHLACVASQFWVSNSQDCPHFHSASPSGLWYCLHIFEHLVELFFQGLGIPATSRLPLLGGGHPPEILAVLRQGSSFLLWQVASFLS